MIMNWIMALTMYPAIIIMYVVVLGVAKKKGTIFGTHLTREMLKEEDVQAGIAETQRLYARQMKAILVTVLLFPLSAFLTRHVSIQFTIWIFWFLGALAIMAVPYINANREMMKLKQKCMEAAAFGEAGAGTQATAVSGKTGAGEQIATATGFRYVELSQVHTVKPGVFLLPLLISAAACLLACQGGNILGLDENMREVLQVYNWCEILFAVTGVIFFLLALWMDGLHGPVISEDSRVNVAYTRARKNVWKNIWLYIIWMNTIVVVGIAISIMLSLHSFGILIWASVLEAVGALGVILVGSRQLNAVELNYCQRKEERFEVDDDRYWVWGMFYNNPHDKRTLVPKLFGMGMTTNMATPAGKASIAVAVLALGWIPFMCLWMIFEDFTPIEVVLREETVICSHLKTEYEIPVEDISGVELVEKLPDWHTKRNGTATDTLEKGRFASVDEGNFYEFLNPENTCFLRIETEGDLYYISGVDDDQTMDVYESICDMR